MSSTIETDSRDSDSSHETPGRRRPWFRRRNVGVALVVALVAGVLVAKALPRATFPRVAPSGAPVLYAWEDDSQDRQLLIDPTTLTSFAKRRGSFDSQPAPQLRTTGVSGRYEYPVGSGGAWGPDSADGCGQTIRGLAGGVRSALPERAVDLQLSGDGRVGAVMFTECTVAPPSEDRYEISASILTWQVALFDPDRPEQPLRPVGQIVERVGNVGLGGSLSPDGSWLAVLEPAVAGELADQGWRRRMWSTSDLSEHAIEGCELPDATMFQFVGPNRASFVARCGTESHFIVRDLAAARSIVDVVIPGVGLLDQVFAEVAPVGVEAGDIWFWACVNGQTASNCWIGHGSEPLRAAPGADWPSWWPLFRVED